MFSRGLAVGAWAAGSNGVYHTLENFCVCGKHSALQFFGIKTLCWVRNYLFYCLLCGYGCSVQILTSADRVVSRGEQDTVDFIQLLFVGPVLGSLAGPKSCRSILAKDLWDNHSI